MFNIVKLKKNIPEPKQAKWLEETGQSLVEMAITAPILVFLLIGVFEVGWAIRGYLTLTNGSREITRFSIRQGYLDYSTKDNNPFTSINTVQYNGVLSYTFTTLARQLSMDFTTGETSTLIISHVVVDTALPCRLEDMANCDCNAFVDPNQPDFYLKGTNVLTYDDLILHPALPGYEYFYAATFPAPPLTSPYRTQLNYEEVAADLARQNNKFNCELMKKSGGTIPAANNVIITELYHNQPQLFGFPLISNPVTDPVPMYAHTAMRMVVASRSGENVDNVGPVCIAAPFTVRNTEIAAATEGSTIIDILGGESPPAGANDKGFVTWNPQWSSQTDLETELTYLRTSFNAYTNARSSTDDSLSIGDYVASLPGNNSGALTEIEALIDKEIIIPVWDSFSSGGGGQAAAWHISSFIKVRVIDSPSYNIDLASTNPTVWAVYLGPASECQ